jgi:hypothetical protein
MKCFVLSPFGMPFDEYYHDVIAPAVRSVGMDVVRADEVYGFRPRSPLYPSCGWDYSHEYFVTRLCPFEIRW